MHDSSVSTLDELVMSICSSFTDNTCHFYCDNVYCHHDLAVEVTKIGHHMTGTVRTSRKDVPCKFVSTKVKKGDLKAFKNQEGVNLVRYKDKREINILTTHNSLEFLEHKSNRGRKSKKPSVIIDYSNYMRGVDTLNQLTFYNW